MPGIQSHFCIKGSSPIFLSFFSFIIVVIYVELAYRYVMVLICPAEELPDEASEKVPDPECKQSDERRYPDKASQEYLTEDYTKDYTKFSCAKASEFAGAPEGAPDKAS